MLCVINGNNYVIDILRLKYIKMGYWDSWSLKHGKILSETLEYVRSEFWHVI